MSETAEIVREPIRRNANHIAVVADAISTQIQRKRDTTLHVMMAAEQEVSGSRQPKFPIGKFVATSVTDYGPSTNEYDLIHKLRNEMRETNPAANIDLVEAVARKVLATKPNYPAWLDLRVFNDRDVQEYRVLPIHEAIATASMGTKGKGLDADSEWKATTVIAQMVHSRLEDGSIKPDEMERFLVDTATDIKRTKLGPYAHDSATQLSSGEIHDIENIMQLAREAARIKYHSYKIEDIFEEAKGLGSAIQHLADVEKISGKGSPIYGLLKFEYDNRKKIYLKKRDRNVEFYNGGESFILNSVYSARTFVIRMRNTLDVMQWLMIKSLPPDSDAYKYRRVMAQNAIGMYYPMLGRMGNWDTAREALGYIVMQILDPGAFQRISKVRDAMPDGHFAAFKDHVVDLVKKDPILTQLREEHGIELEVKSRKKKVVSIWLKEINDTIRYGEPVRVENLHDIFGLRFVFRHKLDRTPSLTVEQNVFYEEKATEAAQRLSTILLSREGSALDEKGAFFRVDLFKSYIQNPKPNSYQTDQVHASVSIPVIGDNGMTVWKTFRCEIQSRTALMDDNANFGDADHEAHKQRNSLYDQAQTAGKEIGRNESIKVHKKRRRRKVRPPKPTGVDEIKKDTYMQRVRLWLGLHDRDRVGTSRFVNTQSPQFITIRTKYGRSIRLKKGDVNGMPLRLLDGIYLATRHLGQKNEFLFDRLQGIRINDRDVPLTPDNLMRNLRNGDHIELTAGEAKLAQTDWAQALGPDGLNRYITLNGARKIAGLPKLRRPSTASEYGQPFFSTTMAQKAPEMAL